MKENRRTSLDTSGVWHHVLGLGLASFALPVEDEREQTYQPGHVRCLASWVRVRVSVVCAASGGWKRTDVPAWTRQVSGSDHGSRVESRLTENEIDSSFTDTNKQTNKHTNSSSTLHATSHECHATTKTAVATFSLCLNCVEGAVKFQPTNHCTGIDWRVI